MTRKFHFDYEMMQLELKELKPLLLVPVLIWT
jgi:hypothetical protein